MSESIPVPLEVVDLDRDALSELALEGAWCLRCPLAEKRPGLGVSPECRTSVDDLAPVALDPRSGIKLALRGRSVVGYAVFGRPALFPGVARLPFEPDPDALFIAALYAVPEAREEHVDAELLIRIVEFARGHGYEAVEAACRMYDGEAPEPAAAFLVAARFEVEEHAGALARARITLAEWDAPDEEGGERDALGDI